MQASICSTQAAVRLPCAYSSRPQARCVARRPSVAVAAAKKGFGSSTKQAKPEQPSSSSDAAAAAADAPSTSAPAAAAAAAVDKEEEIEAMLRRRKSRKTIEPQVKVESAAVDMATGKTPASPVGEAETKVVQVLGIFFFVLLAEGLVLAGSGFLPSEWDPFFRDILYPSFSPQMLLFLGMSSAYGLWKTGKLPGQQQIKS